MPLDIFRKAIEKKPEKTKIIVDFREKNSLVPSELVNLDCHIDFKQLEVGDYISGQYIIERKTMQDLQASLISKRIFSQIQSLKLQKNPILIIENKEEWKLNKNAFYGLVLFIVKTNIPLIFSNNPKETAKYIKLFSTEKKQKEFSYRFNKKAGSKEDIAKYVLEGFPGIGRATSEKLLKKFGNLKNIFLASEEELQEVLGKKALEFKKIID
ncbi:MAG TPA: ERCC4 domain-containing protein [Candidatus Nanoarchaeia archaeon]|nr:ERCC4 domain-containing protein [Candidatus Nanoarchaeia archaeon]